MCKFMHVRMTAYCFGKSMLTKMFAQNVIHQDGNQKTVVLVENMCIGFLGKFCVTSHKEKAAMVFYVLKNSK